MSVVNSVNVIENFIWGLDFVELRGREEYIRL